MEDKDVKRIAVIGAGLMGHGIALGFGLAGHEVRLQSRTEASLRNGMRSVGESLGRLVGLGAVAQEQADAATARIATTTSLAQAVEDVDLVVESVYEDLGLKQALFKELDGLCPEPTVLASNTSGYMPSELASAATHRQRVIVAHFINPPFLVPLVEVVRGPETSDETVETLCALLTAVGKRPVVVQREVRGFVATRLQIALLREALWLVDNGVASPRDVDVVIKTSLGRRWSVAGVFEVLELAGWDLLLAISEGLMPHLASSKAPPLLPQMVERGELGVKTGKGFYDWTPDSAEALRSRIAHALVEVERWTSAR